MLEVEKMSLPVITEFIGSTLRTTWVNTGASASGISSALIDRNGTLVTSASQTSSGNGHYFADLPMPLVPGNYLNEQKGVISSNTYIRYQIVKLTAPEVD
jgi:hypothetical protein